jgi:hypothetical protein
MAIADHYKLNNVVAIIDVNRLGQRGPTMLEHHTEVYAARAKRLAGTPLKSTATISMKSRALFSRPRLPTSQPAS